MMSNKASDSWNMQHPRSAQQSSVWGPGLTIAWGVLIIFLEVITQLAVFLYIAVTKGRFLPTEISASVLKSLVHNGFAVSWATLASSLVCALAVIAIVKLKRDANLRTYLGLVLPKKPQFFQWFVGMFVLLAAFTIICFASGAEVPDSLLRTYESLHSWWLGGLAFIIAGPAFEELFFRGFLITGIASSASRWQRAIIVSLAIWALMHLSYGLPSVALVFVYGLLLGTARVSTGSTILTMIVHSAGNLLADAQIALRLHHLH